VLFQFKLLTKWDWALVVTAFALMMLIFGGVLYVLSRHYPSVSISQGKLGPY
jgi:hypothetical protein